MAKYIYTAKTGPHKTSRGEIEAQTKQEAVSKLTKMGYFPMDVRRQEFSLEKKGFFSLKRISTGEVALFTRQLSSLTESGVNIINALNIISRQTRNRRLNFILNDVLSEVKEGSPLSQSLAKHDRVFSSLYSSMVHAGEASGNLKEILSRLANFLERDEEFKSSLRSALIYPSFIFGVGALTVLVLITFVMPRLVVMFKDMGQALPLPTRVLIGISEFSQTWWWLVLVSVFLFIFLLRRAYRSSQGRVYLDKATLKLPLFGQVILKGELSRLTRILSLLLSSGIPITTALEISVSVAANQALKSEMRRLREEVVHGVSLSSALKGSRMFPELVINLVSIGEETGALDVSLRRISDDYEKDTETTLKNLTKMLEPMIILLMGLVVSFIVLAMLLPIFQINLIVR